MHPQDTIPEEWRPVVGWEGWYSVSSLGHVRRDTTGYIRRAVTDGRGYSVINLTNGSQASFRQHRVHQLVATAFLGPRPPGHGVNHMNGIKTDNRVNNLEWATPAENSRHAARAGLLPAGANHYARQHPERVARGIHNGAHTRPEKRRRGAWNGRARLTTENVQQIRASREPAHVWAARLGVSLSAVEHVRAGHTWRHLL